MQKYNIVALMMITFCSILGAEYYSGPREYSMRPSPNQEWNMGPIGVTGIQARIYRGMKVTVDEVYVGSPADGKLQKGEVILGLDGVEHRNQHPLVFFGRAITKAEATNGFLKFDVLDKSGKKRREVITIPVVGSYGDRFPFDSKKSDMIVKKAAEFYSMESRLKEHNMWNALACLFLLSTGEDKYVGRVKEYFSQFLRSDGRLKNMGNHTWFNGYNGIACAEYYLKTGDRSVIPLLQYYCDDARDRQKFGVGWGHWGYGGNPSYESGGGMQHAAGTQMLTTLLLGKMCGVKVDETTLHGALTHWYRFVGHGAIPVSDQRPYHTFRSAGRDGGTAALMQIASHAEGNTEIYKKAKEYMSMSVLTSWPERQYDWEVYWHSLSGHLFNELRPELYHKTMARFLWRFDLARDWKGGFSWPERKGPNDAMAAGISLALAFTAPLRNLQITGATPSKHAVKFKLPDRLWGNEADLAFLSSEHHSEFEAFGKEEEMHVTFWKFPLRLKYSPDDVKNIPLKTMQKHVRHARNSVRSAAAKALCMNGYYGEIEELLKKNDPRLRRAALDGINDCRPWFTGPMTGSLALKTEAISDKMTLEIEKMVRNKNEAWFVIDAVLNTLGRVPLEVLERNVQYIRPWFKSSEWWLRESAFVAMMGFERDEKRFKKYLPEIIDLMISEYVYNPRNKMLNFMKQSLGKYGKESSIGKMIIAGLSRAVIESEVKKDIGDNLRSKEGTANVIEAALASIKLAPDASLGLAEALAKSGRVKDLDAGSLMRMIKAHDGDRHDKFIGFLPAMKTLHGKEKETMRKILYEVFRPELIRKHLQSGKVNNNLLEMLVDLTRLKKETNGWTPIGSQNLPERVWRYKSYDPIAKSDEMHPRIGAPKRLREIRLPEGLKGWYETGFNDQSWDEGKMPIGKGKFISHGHGRGHYADPEHHYANHSEWGDGEFIVMRSEFELEDLDYDYYRISILANEAYHIYLNGQKIHTYVWFVNHPHYRKIILGKSEIRHLKKGKNLLAAQSVVKFVKNKDSEDYHEIGQIDFVLEGLRSTEVGLKGGR